MATPRKQYHFDAECSCGACPICLELEAYLDDEKENQRWEQIFAKKVAEAVRAFYPTTPLAEIAYTIQLQREQLDLDWDVVLRTQPEPLHVSDYGHPDTAQTCNFTAGYGGDTQVLGITFDRGLGRPHPESQCAECLKHSRPGDQLWLCSGRRDLRAAVRP